MIDTVSDSSFDDVRSISREGPLSEIDDTEDWPCEHLDSRPLDKQGTMLVLDKAQPETKYFLETLNISLDVEYVPGLIHRTPTKSNTAMRMIRENFSGGSDIENVYSPSLSLSGESDTEMVDDD